MSFSLKRIAISSISIALMVSISAVSASATTYYYAENFEYYKNDFGGVTISQYMNDDTVINIPSTLLSNNVNAIGPASFSNDNDLESITIPDSVESIGAFAFKNCYSLSDIIFSSGLSEIVMGAFQNCDSFVTVDLKNTNVVNIPDQMNYSCDNLEKVLLPETAESIGALSFSKCPKLSYIYIPSSVTSIASSAFSNSPNTVIYGYSSTYAETYANENKIPFVALTKYEIGDVDLSGRVDVKDATLIQSYIASLTTLTDEQLAVADVNGDSTINVLDATAVQRSLVGM
ncbi:MAG: leucine-rich repeat protein [Ruminococcus sp.]|nr:leucine-rich repeat protein [Ruminococcus sp.]